MEIAEFVKKRLEIEDLSKEIKHWISEKSVSESYSRLEKANDLLDQLIDMAENDIQYKSVSRLTSELEICENGIGKLLPKKKAGKKSDGNVAFKCNWNDRNYKAPCGDDAYAFNIKAGRAWCSSDSCNCRKFDNDVSLKNHPCYESIALKEYFFAAGWDTGKKMKPRHIQNVRDGRIAILTTRPPLTQEKDRLIIGCLFIEKVEDNPNSETKIFGDKSKSFEIDYNEIKIKFWDYYKKPSASDVTLWSSGLFRHITNKSVLNILKGIEEKYNKNTGRDAKKIIELIKYYESIT